MTPNADQIAKRHNRQQKATLRQANNRAWAGPALPVHPRTLQRSAARVVWGTQRRKSSMSLGQFIVVWDL